MKNELIDLLRNGNHSLVIHRDTTSVYDTRGIATLLQIIDKDSNELSGATVVDKVVGKAAAALMVLGKVKAVYAETISEAALQLFASATDVSVSYHKKVDYIINRTQTGWCPMELATRDATTPEECLERIKAKLIELKGNKK